MNDQKKEHLHGKGQTACQVQIDIEQEGGMR